MTGWAGFWIMVGLIAAAEIYSRSKIRCTEIETDAWDNEFDNDEEDD